MMLTSENLAVVTKAVGTQFETLIVERDTQKVVRSFRSNSKSLAIEMADDWLMKFRDGSLCKEEKARRLDLLKQKNLCRLLKDEFDQCSFCSEEHLSGRWQD